MKTKLLKRLRKEACKKAYITNRKGIICICTKGDYIKIYLFNFKGYDDMVKILTTIRRNHILHMIQRIKGEKFIIAP